MAGLPAMVSDMCAARGAEMRVARTKPASRDLHDPLAWPAVTRREDSARLFLSLVVLPGQF